MSQYIIENKSKISPRTLSLSLLVVFSLLSIILFYPLSLVFSGEWKVNQKIELANQVSLNFEKLGIAGLADLFGWQRVVPIGNISVRFYAICILLAVLMGYFLALYLSKFHYLASTIVDRLIIGLMIFGILGARLFFVAFHWETFASTPLAIITEILGGGMAFFGMLIAGIGYVWLYTMRFRFNFYEFLDFLSPAVLLGQVIGRWGNFFNYESYGAETSVYWKMAVPESANYYADLNSVYFHPTFLYEIIPNFFLLFIILFFYEKLTEKRAGLVFATYAIGYGLIRFVVEFFRLDALKVELPDFLQFSLGYLGRLEYLMASQVAALLLIIIGIIVFLSRFKVLYLKKKMLEFKLN